MGVESGPKNGGRNKTEAYHFCKRIFSARVPVCQFSPSVCVLIGSVVRSPSCRDRAWPVYGRRRVTSRSNPEFCAHVTGCFCRRRRSACLTQTCAAMSFFRSPMVSSALHLTRTCARVSKRSRSARIRQAREGYIYLLSEPVVAHHLNHCALHLVSFLQPPLRPCLFSGGKGEKKGKEKQYCGKEGSSPLCFRFPSFLSWLGRERERGTRSYLVRRGCHGHFMFTVARTMFMPGQHCRTPLFAIF